MARHCRLGARGPRTFVGSSDISFQVCPTPCPDAKYPTHATHHPCVDAESELSLPRLQEPEPMHLDDCAGSVQKVRLYKACGLVKVLVGTYGLIRLLAPRIQNLGETVGCEAMDPRQRGAVPP